MPNFLYLHAKHFEISAGAHSCVMNARLKAAPAG